MKVKPGTVEAQNEAIKAHSGAEENLWARVADSRPDPHRSESLIRIRIEVKSWTRVRIKVNSDPDKRKPDPRIRSTEFKTIAKESLSPTHIAC